MAKFPHNLFNFNHFACLLAQELALQESQLGQFLQGTSLHPMVLQPGNNSPINAKQWMQIWQNITHFDTATDIGLRFGSRMSIAAMGPIGNLLLSAPNLFSSLKAPQEFFPLRVPFVSSELSFEGDFLVCELALNVDLPASGRIYLLEIFALTMQNLSSFALADSAAEFSFTFDFDAPPHANRYVDFFSGQVSFAQPRNAMLFPAALALQPYPVQNSNKQQVAEQVCRELLAHTPSKTLPTSAKVRTVLLSQNLGSLAETDVAAALYISKRTLARRLDQEGSSFRQLRETLLADLATRYLQEQQLSVEAIAALLGYHDSANFRRAFKRWFSITPSDFRKGIPSN